MFVVDSLKKSKQRFGEFEFEYFGDSDVVNKLQDLLLSCTQVEFMSHTILSAGELTLVGTV